MRFAEASNNIIPFRREDAGWRQVGKNRMGRELPGDMHDQMISKSFAAWRMNPFAHRLIELQLNFVLGNGIYINSEDPDTLAAISAFWNNEYNRWPQKIAQRLRDLYLYGEWIHRPIYSQTMAMTYIADIQPDMVSQLLTDPYNHSEIDAVVIKEVVDATGSVTKEKAIPTIRRRLEPTTWTLMPPDGELFHFGINRTTDTQRGVGLLFPILDMLELYDSILFARAEKIENMAHIYYDLQLAGRSEEEIKNYLMQETNVPPDPGSVYAHNEGAQLSIVAPDMKADDHATDTSNLKSFIVASMGWPGTWFDDPGDAGRAVAGEMAEPSLKKIVADQAEVGDFLRTEFNFMLNRMIDTGLLKPSSRVNIKDPFDSSRIPEYTISFSKPSARDFQRLGPALQRFAGFMDSLINRAELITKEEGRRMVAAAVNQLGLMDSMLSTELPATIDRATRTERDEEFRDRQLESQEEIAEAQIDSAAQTAKLIAKSSAQRSPSATPANVRREQRDAIAEAHRVFGSPVVHSNGQVVLLDRR